MRVPFVTAAVMLGVLGGTPTTASPPPVLWAGTVVTELRALIPGSTPATWLAAHRGDEFQWFERRLQHLEKTGVDQWCARARHLARQGGRVIWFREAYFYLPEPPSPAVLPSDDEAAGLVRTRCQLGLVRVEAVEPDEAAGRAAALALRESLSRTYGPNPATAPISLFGSGIGVGTAWFDSVSHWRVGELHVLAAYRRPSGNEQAPGVFAMAALPGSGMAALRPGSPGAADGLAVDEALIARAVVAGGLDPVRAEPLLRALRWIHGVARAHPGAQAPGDPPDLVSMIEDWLRAVAGSAPRARGAALLAAHVLLTHAAQINSEQCAVTGIGSAMAQQRLEAQGARFEPQLTDEGPPSYAGNWLRDAWVLDDGGPVGDLALPLLLEPCAAGEGGFLWAAREGEGFLARPHDRETQASVHLLVAVAYTGGIALAAEEAEELHREPYSAAELDGYRAKAIAHYRAAFATDLAPDAVEEHWGDAWRLIAGLPPLRGPFQCGC